MSNQVRAAALTNFFEVIRERGLQRFQAVKDRKFLRHDCYVHLVPLLEADDETAGTFETQRMTESQTFKGKVLFADLFNEANDPDHITAVGLIGC